MYIDDVINIMIFNGGDHCCMVDQLTSSVIFYTRVVTRRHVFQTKRDQSCLLNYRILIPVYLETLPTVNEEQREYHHIDSAERPVHESRSGIIRLHHAFHLLSSKLTVYNKYQQLGLLVFNFS